MPGGTQSFPAEPHCHPHSRLRLQPRGPRLHRIGWVPTRASPSTALATGLSPARGRTTANAHRRTCVHGTTGTATAAALRRGLRSAESHRVGTAMYTRAVHRRQEERPLLQEGRLDGTETVIAVGSVDTSDLDSV